MWLPSLYVNLMNNLMNKCLRIHCLSPFIVFRRWVESFDGSKNGIGGRLPSYYTNPLFGEAGTASAKSSLKVTVLFGANYKNEPIPPLIVFPTAAKSPKIELKLLQSLHQIRGKFGYSEQRVFNPVIGK